MKILALSGSLRARSSNTVLLRATALVADPSWTFDFYDGLGALPHFNPDLDFEGATPPAAVADLRARIAAADARLGAIDVRASRSMGAGSTPLASLRIQHLRRCSRVRATRSSG